MSIVGGPEQKQETATSLVIIGWICWGFALLVTFFHPAAAKLGRRGVIYTAVILAVVGLALNIIGRRMSPRSR